MFIHFQLVCHYIFIYSYKWELKIYLWLYICIVLDCSKAFDRVFVGQNMTASYALSKSLRCMCFGDSFTLVLTNPGFRAFKRNSFSQGFLCLFFILYKSLSMDYSCFQDLTSLCSTNRQKFLKIHGKKRLSFLLFCFEMVSFLFLC